MSSTRIDRVGITFVTLLISLFAVIGPAYGAENVKALYDKGFGEKDAAVRAAHNSKKTAAFAGELLESAKLVSEDAAYQAYLFNKAYEIGMLYPEGVPAAVDAMDQLCKSQPALKDQANANLLTALQKQYQTTPAKDRPAAAAAYVDRALQIADAFAADGKYEEAIAACNKAKGVLVLTAARHTEVLERLQMLKEEEIAAKRIAELKGTLKKTPTDAIAAAELVHLLMLDKDAPDQALAYVDATGDVKLKEVVGLAARDAGALMDAEALELGDWYRKQADKGGKLANYTAWSRAKTCYQHFLDAHSRADADRLNAMHWVKETESLLSAFPSLARSKVPRGENANAPGSGTATPTAPNERSSPRLIDLLPLIDLASDALVGGDWVVGKDALELRQGGGRKQLRLPYRPPQEYDFIVEFSRSAEKEPSAVCLSCAAGDHDFALQIGNWGPYGSHIVGIHVPPGTPYPTATAHSVFASGEHINSVVQVRRDRITYIIGGNAVTYRTNYSNISWDGQDFGVGHGVLGVGTYSEVVFHKIQVLEITGRGMLISRLDPMSVGESNESVFSAPHGRATSLIELDPIAVQFIRGDPSTLKTAEPGAGVVVNRSPCKTFLYSPAPSSLTYAIPAGAIGFRAVGTRPLPPAENHSADYSGGNLRFIVIVDGKELYKSKPLADQGGQVSVAISIPPGSKRLELLAVGHFVEAVWANPEFVFASALGNREGRGIK